MQKFLKPACFLLYVLALLSFFVLGLLFAGWMDAGKNQGLAGGAIVLGYGIISSFLGLILSLFGAYHLKHRAIVKMNLALSLFLIASISIIFFNAKQRKSQDGKSTNIHTSKPGFLTRETI